MRHEVLNLCKSTDLIKWEMLSQKIVSSHTVYLLNLQTVVHHHCKESGGLRMSC